MMLAAARTLAGNSPALKDSSASLLPRLADLRRAAAEIAVAVGIAAQKDGVAARVTEDELRAQVMATQWTPVYACE
jgi:malate dehydrogenase (oxaloacetate-decarboxylating)